jgi:lipopolysaccharide/colanic/teichoic acid biosynthesis glycosyltransferase
MTTRRLGQVTLHSGTLVILLGAVAIHARRHGYPMFGTARFAWAGLFFGVLILAAYVVGLPNVPAARGRVLSAAFAAFAAALTMSVVQLVLATELLPRFVAFATAFGLTIWWAYFSHVHAEKLAANLDNDRVVFVGTQAEGERLGADTAEAEVPATVVGVVAPGDVRPLSPTDAPLVDFVVEQRASVLVLGRGAINDRAIVKQASTLHESGVRVRSLEAFYADWLAMLPVTELARISLMFDIGEIHEQSYPRVKRMLDIAMALCCALAFVIVLPFVLLGNLVANRGPLLYRQPRVGRNHREFQILKFRSMRSSDSTDWTTPNDPRVTPFGRVLRVTHLDELPQFINILRGDLSFVGPRPEQPNYVAQLSECLPYYELRHLVRPGLTGWAQVKYPYGATEHDALRKLQYDFYYLGHQHLSFDLRVIARTLRSLVNAGGR